MSLVVIKTKQFILQVPQKSYLVFWLLPGFKDKIWRASSCWLKRKKMRKKNLRCFLKDSSWSALQKSQKPPKLIHPLLCLSV